MSMKRTCPISNPISFLTSVDTINYLATYQVQWKKCVRKDSYKLDGVASRAILGRQSNAPPRKLAAFFPERPSARVLGLK